MGIVGRAGQPTDACSLRRHQAGKNLAAWWLGGAAAAASELSSQVGGFTAGRAQQGICGR